MLFSEPLHVGRPNMGSKAAFDQLVNGMFERRWLSNAGPLVVDFETRIAEYLNVKHCVSMANGTIALEIAIRALGLTGEVIVPSYTFIATAHALSWQGLTPVFVDIDPDTHNIDPNAVRRAITPRTSGIIGVHLWGRPAPVEQLQSIADESGLGLLFDAAHAFGNRCGTRMIGGFGDAEVLSFHATKFFNTFEGGAVVTDNDELAEKMRLMRNFGFVDFDKVVYPGTNGKMTEICAAMGIVNFDSISDFVARNVANYEAYASTFSPSPLASLLTYEPATDANHQYVVIELAPELVHHRDRLVAELHEQNVRARRYFWPGCHMMEPYRSQFPDAGRDLPSTNAVADRVVVLPTGTSVTPSDCRLIAGFILDRLNTYAASGA